MSVGARGSALGVDTFVGTRAYSINDKFRITIKTTSLEQYTGLLPNAPMADNLADLVFFHIGYRFEYDVELSLPARLAPPAQLGVVRPDRLDLLGRATARRRRRRVPQRRTIRSGGTPQGSAS